MVPGTQKITDGFEIRTPGIYIVNYHQLLYYSSVKLEDLYVGTNKSSGRNFDLAHELRHSYKYKDMDEDGDQEQEANYFASCFTAAKSFIKFEERLKRVLIAIILIVGFECSTGFRASSFARLTQSNILLYRQQRTKRGPLDDQLC